jgi:DNA repair exonuclease SbcCD ATPase subunit
MRNGKLIRPTEVDIDLTREINELTRRRLDQAEGTDSEISADTLVREASETSMREIESLIVELQQLRKKLQTNSNRIQRDITEHTELNQQVMQLTGIISESVKKLPAAPSISHDFNNHDLIEAT